MMVQSMFLGLYCTMSEEQLHTAVAGPLNVMDVPSTIYQHQSNPMIMLKIP